MDSLIYVVAILGCADGGELCQPVRLEPARYESKAACLAAATAALPAYTALPFPQIEARCEARGVQMAALGR